MSRLMLQILNAALAIITIMLAGASLLLGADSPVYGSEVIPQLPSLDSNLRFMGGMGLGLGLALLWITPRIEKQGKIFQVVWICALLGGIGRIISFAMVGLPPLPLVIFTIIEVPGVPLLIYWQVQVAKSYKASTTNVD